MNHQENGKRDVEAPRLQGLQGGAYADSSQRSQCKEGSLAEPAAGHARNSPAMLRQEVLAAIIAEGTIPCPHYVGGLRPCRLDPTTIVLGCDGLLVNRGIKCGKEAE